MMPHPVAMTAAISAHQIEQSAAEQSAETESLLIPDHTANLSCQFEEHIDADMG
jgi:hypothetical protein